MLKGKTNFITYGNIQSIGVRIPAGIRKDSNYKFNETKELNIEVADKKIIITQDQT